MPLPQKSRSLARWLIAGLIIGFVLVDPVPAKAGEFNQTITVGQTAPEFEKLPATDGKHYSVDHFADAKVVVVVFTCNTCPYAVDLEDRLIQFTKDYATKDVKVVAINSNSVKTDDLEAMIDRAKEHSFPYYYLSDASQAAAKAYGAKYTPECFVLDGKRSIVYMGSFDDSPDGKNVAKRYVIDAVESVLAGKKVATAESVPIGCKIRFPRERRKRSR